MAWRFELKYLVDAATHEGVRRVVASYLVPGEHVGPDASYPVLSQYYDGPRLPFYLEKVAGVESRVKIRLRTYGWAFGSEAPWFLEVKRKENSSISKIRLPVEPFSIDPCAPATWDALDHEKLAPFISARELMRLEPTAQVWYQREVHESAAGDLRVTFDRLVRALYPGECMKRALLYDTRRAALPDDRVIIEIKTAQKLPHWLSNVVREASMVPDAISKYVHAMNALGLSRKVLATC